MKANKIIDKNGRLFGVISIIDVVLILILVVVAVSYYMKNSVMETSGGGQKDVGIEIVIMAETLPSYLAESILVGDTIYDSTYASGGAIGVVTKVEYLPSQTLAIFSNGTYQAVSAEDSYNLRVTVEGKGIYSEGRYSINRVYEIGVNAARFFTTKYATFVGRVQTVNVIEG